MGKKFFRLCQVIFGVVLVSVLGLFNVSTAATLNVCPSGCEYSSIQSAIMAASPGDTVLVADGTYMENINFGGKGITVQAVNGAQNAIIDGILSSMSVVTFNSGEGIDSVLDGFTIRNGMRKSAFSGGGIYCGYSSPTISNCIITSNKANWGGGGIACESSSATITNCTINNNRVIVFGGGIFCDWLSSATITNCTISGNTADHGGGIACWDSSPTITNCTISGNTADYEGGGILTWGSSSPAITNCTISSNTADYGSGIVCDNSSPTITNCTISGNSAVVVGGGIACSSSSSPTVVNSILWGDTAGGSPDEIYLGGTSLIDITYSDIQGGWTGTGNIDANPLFVGNGDYHLTAGSPCIDTGTDDTAIYSNLPTDDIDGDARPQGAGYDMGSDEYNGGFVCTDGDGDGYYSHTDCGTELDCDDTVYSMNPGATEVCDGMDNNCDGNIDEGVTNTYYRDTDGDTYGDPNNSIQDCTVPSGYVTDNTDCDDTDASINPGATEVCDGVDNNCDGQIDEGVTNTYYRDADWDTYGDPNNTTGDCTVPSGYVSDNTDCDDTDAGINPGATEVCDGVDNNCDGNIDEGCCTDNDGDGYAVEGGDCGPVDCDDNNAKVNPGMSESNKKKCGDGIDNDCDGLVDGDDPDCGGADAEICDNGIDDDGDGKVDCADRDCRRDPACDGGGAETNCKDGKDNDGDGLTDCADPDCDGSRWCS